MDAPARPRLTSRQLGLVSAITRSPRLKRALVEATEVLPPGAVVRLGRRFLEVGGVLGSGLVGVVYEARCLETGARLAYKRPRAGVAFFREALRVEALAARRVAALRAIRPAAVVEADALGIAKELREGPTLQAELLAGEVDPGRRAALVEALGEAGELFRREGILLDLSPKNLCWDGGWVLLDTGPKLHRSELVHVLAQPGWSAYVAHVRRKLAAGPSAPSAVALPAGPEPQAAARRWAFVRDLWRWFPFDPAPDVASFLGIVDDDQADDEAVFLIDGADGRVEPAPGADVRLAGSALVRRCAEEAPDRPVRPSGEAPPPLSLPLAGPVVELSSLSREVAPAFAGRALKIAVAPGEPLAAPTLPVERYGHWRDLADADSALRPTDIFAHEVLEGSRALAERVFRARGARRIDVPLPRSDGPFAELTCMQVGESRRAIVLVPGFRAGPDAAAALVSALAERGVAGLYAIAYLGVRNPGGQPLVTSGRWEAILLWSAIDYLCACLGAAGAAVLGASHGNFGAMIVAGLHPAVDCLALDSPLERPLDLPVRFGALRGVPAPSIYAELAAHHLPSEPVSFRIPERPGLRVLTLRPRQDSFARICGGLEGGEVVVYDGQHAATMRHDSAERGIPAVCVERLSALLEAG
ncbi:uncharacterized protein SOCE26_084580 [Sorangium cellulosum]|uniref:Protein kinase domain-containing protein n=1 Tax=Sorangium cellulosum TaxID=56 RepID=A0A2L0F5T0_SORCE|nr:hypothetical protein [Sorangium cellulosum]AUX46948.1 uncharacterized protein SOCE26_084580 [Sorangium cellulosum]